MPLKLALQAARDEYETRRERQRQGIEKAKQEGRYAGRPKDPTPTGDSPASSRTQHYRDGADHWLQPRPGKTHIGSA